MNNLETYFQGEYKADANELLELDSVITKVVPTFANAFTSSGDFAQWPYNIKSGKKIKSLQTYSPSTNSMILAMMNVVSGESYCEAQKNRSKNESFFKIYPDIKPNDWDDKKNKAVESYRKYIYTRIKEPHLTMSETYGYNDPLSLSWCYDVFNADKNVLDAIKNLAKYEKNDKVLTFYDIEILPHEEIYINTNEETITEMVDKKLKKKPEVNTHSFLRLKKYQLLEKIGAITIESRDDFFNFFERRIHLHLSYSDIPDSRFDPAELVFSLEGAIRCKNDNAVSGETVERVFLVLEAAQNLTPYWRPINPIYATAQGQVLLPLSVEVANSLLRICAMLDNNEGSKENYFSKHAGMFKRYFRWLKAQLREVEPICESDGATIACWGWASEHVGGDDEIHLFQTSEILCFLIDYRHMLQDRIARRSLESSGLKVMYQTNYRNKSQSKTWLEIVDEYEPLLELPDDSHNKVYAQIGKRFIEPRLSLNSDSKVECSMLLYGPPGTGKSTVGRNISKVLGWKFITVTPSDFLAGGSAEVEARAKFIFKCLEEQKEAVILFDEIDEFLLDRSSRSYNSQSGIFKFMTPGMLPKLNDLREVGRSIFIVATNYEYKIDPAIKRSGRIDYSAPLMIPAFSRRKEFLRNKKLFSFEAEKTAGCTIGDLRSNGLPSVDISHYETLFSEIKDFNNRVSIDEIVIILLIFLQKNEDDFFSIDTTNADDSVRIVAGKLIEHTKMKGMSVDKLKDKILCQNVKQAFEDIVENFS
jgi:hypothetical protein